MNLSKLIKSTGKYDLSIFSAESIDRIELLQKISKGAILGGYDLFLSNKK